MSYFIIQPLFYFIRCPLYSCFYSPLCSASYFFFSWCLGGHSSSFICRQQYRVSDRPSLLRGTPRFRFRMQYIYLFFRILATTSVVDMPSVRLVALNFPSFLHRSQASSTPAVTQGMSSWHTQSMFILVRNSSVMIQGAWGSTSSTHLHCLHISILYSSVLMVGPELSNGLPLWISMSSWSHTPAISHIFWPGNVSRHCLNMLAWPIWKESKTPSAYTLNGMSLPFSVMLIRYYYVLCVRVTNQYAQHFITFTHQYWGWYFITV